jgi:general secretion pathway protein J
MNATTQRQGPGGFTLVEVLVALFIMAVLAAMAWQGVDGIVATRNASKTRMEQLLRVNSVLAQFQQDLEFNQESCALPQSTPYFDGISLRITRRTSEGLQLVVWSLRGGTWLRWAGPSVTTVRGLTDQWMNSQQFMGNEPGQLRALTGITEWQAYCFRGNAWSNCQSSAGSGAPGEGSGGSAPPPPTASKSLCLAQDDTNKLNAMRVVLSFGEGSGYTGNVTRDIALGVQ